MKKLLFTAALLVGTLAAMAQGTVNFNNRVPGEIDAPVTDAQSGARLDGTTWSAALYAGPAGTAEDALVLVGAVVGFRTGVVAGYVNVGSLGERVIAGVAPGAQAAVQVRAWSAAAGASYEAAKASGNPLAKIGKSNILTLATGGTGIPPGPPANLAGLNGFSVTFVPEPSTIALGILGAGALLMLRRRK